MNKTVTSRNTFSAAELAEMRLPKFPRSRKSWYELAEREKWEFIEVPGKGPGGMRREFKPSESVMALIEQRRRGELPYAQEKPPSPKHQAQGQVQTLSYGVAEPEPRPEERPHGVDGALLRLCLGACNIVYGESFAAESVALQLEYVADLYNQIVRHASANQGGYNAGIRAFLRLETRGLADQLRLYNKMQVVRPYRSDNEPLSPGAEGYAW